MNMKITPAEPRALAKEAAITKATSCEASRNFSHLDTFGTLASSIAGRKISFPVNELKL